MKKTILSLLLVIFFSIFTVLPLFKSGFFPMHDDTQVARVYEMGKALGDGQFPVRWVDDLGYGYGYPIFNFYSPLPYYIGGFLTLVDVDSLIATKIMFVVGILLASISMYFFAERFFGQLAGIASSVVFTYFPYHAINIYVRGAVGEFFAYAFLPLVFLGLSRRWMWLSSVSIFLVIVSHNLTALMLVMLLAVFIPLNLLFSKERKKLLIFYALSISFGILFSAFYSLPAIFEMKYTNVLSQVGGGADYKDHFVCPSQLWNSMWSFGGSTNSCLDGMSFKLGKTNILFVMLSILLFVYLLSKHKIKPDKKVAFISSLVLLLFSILLVLPISKPVWDIIPPMKFLQYPWRFINFIALFASLLVGFLIFGINEFNKKFTLVVVVGVVCATLIFNAKLFVPQTILDVNSDYYTNERMLKFKASKISDEYMPKGFVKPVAESNVPSITGSIGEGGNLSVISQKTGYVKLSYQSEGDNTILINKAHFPAWRAYINSENVNLTENSTGMEVGVLQGDGIVELKFEQTLIEIIANLITFFAFLAIITYAILLLRRKRSYGK